MRTDETEITGPHHVDVHVGSRVRIRRKFLGMSQEQLGARIRLTFQQIQKYERGSNRISASKLFEIAKALDVPVAYFYDHYGVEDNATLPSELEQLTHSFLMTSDGMELAAAFPRIHNVKHRRRILDLVRALGEESDNN